MPRYKFIRKKSSGSSGRSASRLAPIALLAALALSIPLTGYIFKTMMQTAHVDPAVIEALSKSESTYAYVAVRGAISIKADKAWRFGDLTIYKARITKGMLSFLSHHPNVISIYAERHFANSPLHYLDAKQYPFREHDIDNEFHKALGPWIGRNVTVAIIDTGIDYTHPDFYDEHNKSIIKVLVSMLYVSAETGEYILWEPYKNGTMEELLAFDVQLWDQYGEPAFLDINGHGTHCSGILAGRGWASNGKYMGIAPGAYLVIIKAFNQNGEASMDSCLDALEWVYDNAEKYDIKVLSLSWGARFASRGDDPLSLAVNKIAEDKGVLVFAAAGNEGNIPTTISVPAVAEKAFAVGAWDAYYDKIAPFSSLGPTVDLRMKPDLMASGVMVVSCKSQFADFPDEYEVNEYYVALSGTSMATPASAGIAADFIEYYRYWHHRDPSISDFTAWLETNSRHINFIKDFISGWGIPIAPHG